MILAIDIGNSSISCGIFADTDNAVQTKIPECICRFKIAAKPLSADEYLLIFTQFLQFYNIRHCLNSADSDENTLHACVIASVVPALTDIISRTAEILTGTKPLIIANGIRTGFGIKIKNPEQLGADLAANAAGALLFAEPPFVILDVGTATTITYMSKDKELLGTVIMPGLTISISALSESAALLSHVSLDHPKELLGKTTEDSIQSGVINGHALMIDGFLRNIREQYQDPKTKEKINLIATGGLAEAILPFCRNKFQYVSDLTLIGAVSLYRKNRIR